MNTSNYSNISPEILELLVKAGAHQTTRLDGSPMLVLTTVDDSISKFVELVKEQYASVLQP